MKKYSHIVILILFPILIQAQDAKELLRLYFNDVRSEKYPPIPLPFSLPENANKTLSSITVYEKDTAATVRLKAYGIVRFVGDKSRQTPVREKAVQQLVQATYDKDAGNVGAAIEYLTQFKIEDFNKAALDGIRTRLNQNPPHLDKLLRLMGYIEHIELTENIRPYTQPGNNKSLRWAAIVALARMGDESAITDMLTRAKKLPLNDDIIYNIFPDLIYTRQRAAFDYVIEILNSDEKNCTTSGETPTPIFCGYRIMEQLAKVIEGYPIPQDESGDLNTTDYEQALLTIRTWFKEHKDYKILKNTY